ncbi:hypothetical protein FA15DRAFT_655841 [Coprinopsis marcescibilis]|uniref:Uncharacterized protein n=1 Tax=Coprinopsis marcescibilis TaxID=230819 RepID=A0A5C3KVG5_COPMA|nr:hypothetical protein FA15DRAFT_655841 [Coprinopsis marcescibilis]
MALPPLPLLLQSLKQQEDNSPCSITWVSAMQASVLTLNHRSQGLPYQTAAGSQKCQMTACGQAVNVDNIYGGSLAAQHPDLGYQTPQWFFNTFFPRQKVDNTQEMWQYNIAQTITGRPNCTSKDLLKAAKNIMKKAISEKPCLSSFIWNIDGAEVCNLATWANLAYEQDTHGYYYKKVMVSTGGKSNLAKKKPSFKTPSKPFELAVVVSYEEFTEWEELHQRINNIASSSKMATQYSPTEQLQDPPIESLHNLSLEQPKPRLCKWSKSTLGLSSPEIKKRSHKHIPSPPSSNNPWSDIDDSDSDSLEYIPHIVGTTSKEVLSAQSLIPVQVTAKATVTLGSKVHNKESIRRALQLGGSGNIPERQLLEFQEVPENVMLYHIQDRTFDELLSMSEKGQASLISSLVAEKGNQGLEIATLSVDPRRYERGAFKTTHMAKRLLMHGSSQPPPGHISTCDIVAKQPYWRALNGSICCYNAEVELKNLAALATTVSTTAVQNKGSSCPNVAPAVGQTYLVEEKLKG